MEDYSQVCEVVGNVFNITQENIADLNQFTIKQKIHRRFIRKGEMMLEIGKKYNIKKFLVDDYIGDSTVPNHMSDFYGNTVTISKILIFLNSIQYLIKEDGEFWVWNELDFESNATNVPVISNQNEIPLEYEGDYIINTKNYTEAWFRYDGVDYKERG